jgi:phosphoribosylaminoimidazole-succinocarboxamide synthase
MEADKGMTERELSDLREKAMRIPSMTEEEYQRVLETVEEIDYLISAEADGCMLIHVDGKKKFAFDEKPRLTIVGTFGTADEDRWWDQESYATWNFCGAEQGSRQAVLQGHRLL